MSSVDSAERHLIPIRVKDSLIDYKEYNPYAIVSGALHNTFKTETADTVSSSGVNANVQHTFRVPSLSNSVNPCILLESVVTFTFAGATPAFGQPLIQLGSNDGPAAFPLASCMNSMELTISDSSVSTNLNDYFSAMIHYDTCVCQYTGTPNMLDQYQDLNDWTTYGSARNPLAKYGENAYQQSRGSFQPISDSSSAAGGVTTQVISFSFIEPLFISPFFTSYDKCCYGFTGVGSITINIIFDDMRKAWSHASGGNPLTSVTATISQSTTKFHVNYLALQTYQLPPQMAMFPYRKVVRYTQNVGLLASTPVSYLTQTAQLDAIPHQVYLFAQQRKADKSYLSSQTFAAITNVKLNFDAQQTILSTASQYQLYEISRRNGNKQTWEQFIKFQGSVVCLNFGTDIELPSDVAPGVRGKYTLSVDVTLQNVNTTNTTINYDLMMVVVYDGIAQLSEGHTNLILGPMTKESVAMAEYTDLNTASIQSEELGGGILGGGILGGAGSFASFLKPLGDILKPAAQLAAPLLKPALGVAKPFLGTALDVAEGVGEAATLGRDILKLVEGSGKRGGKRVSRVSMADRLR